jgi:predicted amidophosphoribosyltransferase
MGWGTLGRATRRALIELLAPDRCLACRGRARLPWCGGCAEQVRRPRDPCRRCAADRLGGHPCWPAEGPIRRTVAAFDYTGPVAASIRTAKLSGAWAGWSWLGSHLAAAARSTADDVDAVTWVATDRRRARRRGFDHAELLAKAVAGRLRLPCVGLLETDERREIPIRVRVSSLPATSLLLVDDVMTTGVTASRSAGALLRAGAGEITLGVVARAGHHPLTVSPPAAIAGQSSSRMAQCAHPHR